MDTHIGSAHQGFTVRHVDSVELLNSQAIQLEHDATGLRFLHIKNEDVENLFSIVFPTPPPDDTGTPHILEHSVLAGSEKYPAREGVLELMKRSVATFINGMTANEHTLYPVSSTVPRDLFNLADVYWDAVFHPLLTRHTFRREGHRLEFATPTLATTELTIKGVVYSEMQGAYSAPESLIHQAMTRGLFPDTAYGLDAGGDPNRIVELTYEKLKAFHAEYYNPSQALVVAYGNVPTEEYLAFMAERLGTRSRKPRAPSIGRQPRFAQPRRSDMRVSVTAADAERAWLALGWICGDGTDPLDVMQMRLLHLILLGHSGAVLRKAILDARLGEDLAMTHLDAQCLETTFMVGVHGASSARAEEFEAFVLQTLRDTADQGLPLEAIETACQQLAYSTLQINDHFPVALLMSLSAAYVLTGDPVTSLHSAEHLRLVRERALREPAHLGRLLRERLVDNPHRLLVVAQGDPTLSQGRNADMAKKLRARKASLTSAEVEKLVSEAREFELIESQSDEAAFVQLPKFSLLDLPKVARTIDSSLEREGRFDFLTNQVFANGINYLHLDVDAQHIPIELLPYMGLFIDCIGKIGTSRRSWDRVAAEVASRTNGIRGWAQLNAHATDAAQVVRTMHFYTSFLDGHAEKVTGLLQELLFDSNFEDRARLGDILTEMRAQGRAQLANRATQLSRCRAARNLSPESYLTDECHGVPQLRRIERLAAGFSAGDANVINDTVVKLQAIRDAIPSALRLYASFTGTEGDRKVVQTRLATWLGSEVSASVPTVFTGLGILPSSTGLAGAMDVAFCHYGLKAPGFADPLSAALSVATKYFTDYYILDEIRLRGAAYGAWCEFDSMHHCLLVSSYSDPQIARTVGVFQAAAAAAQKLDWSQQDLERAVLTTSKDSLKPNRPWDATLTALWWHVHGLSRELRQSRYDSIVSVQAAEARQALCDLLQRGQDQGSLSVVASREQLEAANRRLGNHRLEIEDILSDTSKS